MAEISNIVQIGNLYFERYHLYMKRLENGIIPVDTEKTLRVINTNLLLFKNTLDQYRSSIGKEVEVINDEVVVNTIKEYFVKVQNCFDRIDRKKSVHQENLIKVILYQKKEIVTIEDKFNLAPTDEEKMWLKFMYLEFSTRIVHNLGKLRLTEGKIFNSEINLLLQNYENIKADLKIKHDSMRLLMIKYPLILNDQNISTIGHLYDHPKVWKEFFSDIKEITSTGAADSEEVIAHQMLVKEFTIGLQKILKRFDLGVEGGGGIEGGGGGGGGGGKDPVDWRADLFNVLKGDIDLENPIPNKQVVSQKISQDAIDNANMKAAELLAQEPGFKSQKPNTRGKTSKGKQKNKGGKKRNPNTKKSTPNEKKQSYEAEGAASAKGHQATFEEAVQNAMYATLGSGAKFAEVKRVKRWDISNLDAPYILEHPDIFPEYRGLSERELNHQILLHSGNRLHRLLMDPNLLEKFAHKVKGGFTMDAILHLKDGTQVSGRFEFGLGEQDQKVFHRGFRRHMWGRDFQNLAEVNLGNGEQQRQQHQDEEEEFKAVGGSTVKVDEEENIIVTYENHSFVAGCTILPKR